VLIVCNFCSDQNSFDSKDLRVGELWLMQCVGWDVGQPHLVDFVAAEFSKLISNFLHVHGEFTVESSFFLSLFERIMQLLDLAAYDLRSLEFRYSELTNAALKLILPLELQQLHSCLGRRDEVNSSRTKRERDAQFVSPPSIKRRRFDQKVDQDLSLLTCPESFAEYDSSPPRDNKEKQKRELSEPRDEMDTSLPARLRNAMRFLSDVKSGLDFSLPLCKRKEDLYDNSSRDNTQENSDVMDTESKKSKNKMKRLLQTFFPESLAFMEQKQESRKKLQSVAICLFPQEEVDSK